MSHESEPRQLEPHLDPARVLALALYEVRLLLSGHLGPTATSDPAVRQAAYLAYALHNQALQLLEGKSFDVEAAIQGLAYLDREFEPGFVKRFREGLTREA